MQNVIILPNGKPIEQISWISDTNKNEHAFHCVCYHYYCGVGVEDVAWIFHTFRNTTENKEKIIFVSENFSPQMFQIIDNSSSWRASSRIFSDRTSIHRFIYEIKSILRSTIDSKYTHTHNQFIYHLLDPCFPLLFLLWIFHLLNFIFCLSFYTSLTIGSLSFEPKRKPSFEANILFQFKFVSSQLSVSIVVVVEQYKFHPRNSICIFVLNFVRVANAFLFRKWQRNCSLDYQLMICFKLDLSSSQHCN